MKPVRVDDNMPGNSEEPGAEPVGIFDPVETIQPVKGPREHLTGDVFCLVPVTQTERAIAEDRFPIPVEQDSECLAVTQRQVSELPI